MKLSDVPGDQADTAPTGGSIKLSQIAEPPPRKELTGLLPDPFIDVAPAAINFLDYPARAVAADIYGVTSPLYRGQPLTRESYETARERSLAATEIPETATGRKISSVLNIPGELIGGAARAFGEVGLSKERAQQLAPFAGAGMDVASLLAPVIAPKLPGVPTPLFREPISWPTMPPPSALERQAAREQAAVGRAQTEARTKVTSAYEKGLREGGPGAIDIMENLAGARAEGQPFTLADVRNPELDALLGTVYRQGGEGRAIIKDFMTGRNIEQGKRIREQLKKYISDESASATAEELIQQRSMNAKPLFDKAAAVGPIWSDRLAEFRNAPEVQQGINRGFAMERRKAIGDGVPFNPTDYSVVDFDAAGDPIIDKVPKMRLWMVAKEGLDAAVEDRIDKETGRPTKDGLSYIKLRNGLVAELDRLNPDYAQARAQWEGDTQSRLAINKGKHLLDTKWFPEVRDVQNYLNSIPPADREFVKVGLAAQMSEQIGKAADSADKAKRVINSDIARERVPLLLGSEAPRFLDAIERERVMRETPVEGYGKSPTAERLADDERLIGHLSRAIAYIPHLFPSAIRYPLVHAIHAMVEKLGRPNKELNAAIAKLLTDPNIQVQAGFGEPLLVPPPGPPARGRRPLSPIEGALIGAAGAQATAPQRPPLEFTMPNQ